MLLEAVREPFFSKGLGSYLGYEMQISRTMCIQGYINTKFVLFSKALLKVYLNSPKDFHHCGLEPGDNIGTHSHYLYHMLYAYMVRSELRQQAGSPDLPVGRFSRVNVLQFLTTHTNINELAWQRKRNTCVVDWQSMATIFCLWESMVCDWIPQSVREVKPKVN